MNKFAIGFFTFIGIIMPIFVGLLHMYVHFNELILPEVQNYLQKPILIMKENTPIWDAWGVMSVMMGMSFIVIGILNINTLREAIKKRRFSLITLFAMLLYCCSSIYVGHTFNAVEQFYAGIVGSVMVLTCIALGLTVSKNEKRTD